MKRIVSILLVVTLLLGMTGTMTAALADETPTLRLLTQLHTEQTAAVEDLWFFKHLEKKFNVKFELEATEDPGTRTSLMFAADDMPDMVWMPLSNSDAMTYGVEEGMLLDWTPYLNEETMPNAWKAKQDYPEAFAASVTPDGKLYSLPYIRGPIYANNTGAFSATIRMNINTQWLKDVGMEMPATLNEFLDVARAFKAKDPAGMGEQLIPIIDNQNKVKEYIWNALGFYGGGNQQYGTSFAIKNDQVVLPAYTPDAKLFMETVKTMYDEGLISPDYFTLDSVTNRGLVSSGVCGIFGDSTLQPAENNWQNWTAMSPLSSDVNDTRVASINFGYSIGSYASAKTEHPEVVAKIVDYMYSDDGAMLYHTGPMKGTEEDFENKGWYILDNGTITTDAMLKNPSLALTNGNTAWYYISGRFDNFENYRYTYANKPQEMEYRVIKDVITGRDVNVPVTDSTIWADDNWDRHWRVTQTGALEDYLTFIRLPSVFLTQEEEERVSDLRTVIESYITQETPKFITGTRSLDEFDAYQQELKDLGIEEYIGIYTNAYASFIADNFAK